MALSKATETFNCSVEQFWDLIVDYEKYPEFLSDVKKISVKQDGDSKIVSYEVSVIKTVRYDLRHKEIRPTDVKWNFVRGDMIKKMTGSWHLEDVAGRCKADYAVDVDFGLFVPGAVVKTLQDVNLKNMMSAFHKRVKDVYGI